MSKTISLKRSLSNEKIASEFYRLWKGVKGEQAGVKEQVGVKEEAGVKEQAGVNDIWIKVLKGKRKVTTGQERNLILNRKRCMSIVTLTEIACSSSHPLFFEHKRSGARKKRGCEDEHAISISVTILMHRFLSKIKLLSWPVVTAFSF